MTDAKGGRTIYVYDPVGRLTEVHRYAGVTAGEIGLMHGATYSTDLAEIVTKYKYDRRGLLLEERGPLDQITLYTYDANGNLESKTDAGGNLTQFEYDAVNNLAKVAYQDGRTVAYERNPINQVTTLTDWLGETRYDLDALGRVLKVKDYQERVYAR